MHRGVYDNNAPKQAEPAARVMTKGLCAGTTYHRSRLGCEAQRVVDMVVELYTRRKVDDHGSPVSTSGTRGNHQRFMLDTAQIMTHGRAKDVPPRESWRRRVSLLSLCTHKGSIFVQNAPSRSRKPVWNVAESSRLGRVQHEGLDHLPSYGTQSVTLQTEEIENRMFRGLLWYPHTLLRLKREVLMLALSAIRAPVLPVLRLSCSTARRCVG